ncbi:MAG: ROK family protein [Acidimicrobiaceae bacterium]|nr:ROK family protein [Acidimicrobiaceae bacterium]
MASIGIDLGGTKILAVLVDNGEVLDKHKLPTPSNEGPEGILAAMTAAAREVDPDGVASGIGVGVPGPVVPGSGVLPLACNLSGWASPVDVAGELSARFDQRPVFVDNDCNAATLAEHRLGAGRGVDDLVGVFMGTGVGAGLILDGRLRRGPRGMAGEIGHMVVDFSARRDEEGLGELEDYAGRSALERRARTLHAQGESSALIALAGEGRMKSKLWKRALDEGDRVAFRLIDQAAEALSSALASVVDLIDIEMVVLGGGMAERLGPEFLDDVAARLETRVFAGNAVPVRAASTGDIGGALGAALLVEEGQM